MPKTASTTDKHYRIFYFGHGQQMVANVRPIIPVPAGSVPTPPPARNQ